MNYKKTIQITTSALLLLSFVIMPNALFAVIADDFELSPNSTDSPVAEISAKEKTLKAEINAEIENEKIMPSITNTKITSENVGVITEQEKKTNNPSNIGGIADDFILTPNIIVNPPIADEKQTDGAVVTEYDVYIGKNFTPEIQSIISDMEVKPSEIFSPVFSEIENLVVNPIIEDGKVVHRIEIETNADADADADADEDIEEETLSPKQQLTESAKSIFDLRINKPVEFRITDNRIIVNNEQIIDYKEIAREKEVMPPIELEINSAITNGKAHNLSLLIDNKQHKEREHVSFYWTPDSAKTDNENIQDWKLDKNRNMPIYSDFKIEDKKLSLIHNESAHDIKILPPEIYSAVHNLSVKEPKIVIKELSLGIENEKAVYNLKVEQSAKILWIIPWTIQSKYLINPIDGSAEIVDKPWYITSEKFSAIYSPQHELTPPNPMD